MKRSLAFGWILVSMLSGCGAPEPVVEVDEPAPVAIVSPRAQVTLATTTPEAIPAPAPRIAPPPAPRVTHASDELTLRRLVVATDVADHEPVGASDTIDHDAERVYAFIDAQNPGDEATLVVTFTSDDGAHTVGHVDVSVPAHTSRWRTWAYSRHLSPGLWHAEVRTTDGRLVDDHAFEVR
jgi:hypothetical protein